YITALKKVESELGKDYPLVIGGEKIYTDEKLTSVNPANTEQVVGNVSMATKEHVEKAMDAAKEAFKEWKKRTAEELSEVLLIADASSRSRKHVTYVRVSSEENKPWSQADGDTEKANDFMEYYICQMVRLGKGREVNDPLGENNAFFYEPLRP